VIIQAIKAIEEVAPVSGAGKDKLDTILEIVSEVSGDIPNITSIITTIVSKLVSLFNKLGIFKKVI
jgi:hypothetical protein